MAEMVKMVKIYEDRQMFMKIFKCSEFSID